MYILKVGSSYVGQEGQIVMSQAEALQVDLVKASDVRVVKLVPKRQHADPSGGTSANVSPF